MLQELCEEAGADNWVNLASTHHYFIQSKSD